jgi:hypothetical protein
LGSYYIAYANKYLPIYSQYEYFFDSSETSIPSGFVANKKIEVMNQNDVKTTISATNYEYFYANQTKKNVTLNTGVVIEEKFTY